MDFMVLRINKTKSRYYMYYFFMFLMFLLPSATEDIFPIYLTQFIKLVSYGLLVINFLKTRKTIYYSFMLIVVYNVILVFSTFINSGGLVTAIKHALVIMLICYTLITIFKSPYKTEIFVRVIRDIVLMFFIINIIMFFIYPNGIPSVTDDPNFPNFLYGNVNSTIKHIIPGMCCSSIIDIKNKKRMSFKTAIFFFGIFYQALTIYFTATSVAAALFLLIWLLLILRKDRINVKQIYTFSVIFILVFEVLFIFNTGIVGLVSSLFGKDPTLSGRTYLWQNMLDLVSKKPLFGYGALEKYDLSKLVGNYFGSHNYYLDTLFQRGIFGLINLILIIVYPILKYSSKNKNLIIDTLFGYSIACLLIFLAEPIYTKEYLTIPIFYALIYFIDKFNENKARHFK